MRPRAGTGEPRRRDAGAETRGKPRRVGERLRRDFDHKGLEARSAPGLDEMYRAAVIALAVVASAGRDRKARQRLAPRHGPDQFDQRADARIASRFPFLERVPIRRRSGVADQDLRRAPVRHRQRQPVGETLLGADEQRHGCRPRIRRIAVFVARPTGSSIPRRSSWHRRPQIEVARPRIVLGLEAARRPDHPRDTVILERDAAHRRRRNLGRELGMVDRVEHLHRRGVRRGQRRAERACHEYEERRAPPPDPGTRSGPERPARAPCQHDSVQSHRQSSRCSKRSSPMRPPSMRNTSR